MVLPGEKTVVVLTSLEHRYQAALFQEDRCVKTDDLVDLDAPPTWVLASDRMVYDGSLVEPPLTTATATRIDIRALARILLPQAPLDGNHWVASLPAGSNPDLQTQAPCQWLYQVYQALGHVTGKLPMAVIHAIMGVLRSPSHQDLYAYFKGYAEQATSSEPCAFRVSDIVAVPPLRLDPNPPPQDPPDAVSLEAIDDVLGPEGPLADRFDNYEWRPGQVQMAHAVAEAFNQRTHLLVEAGTGTGKSLAYLLPSILWATQNHMPVVISTNTKNLQSQLFEKDLPNLRDVSGLDFKAALIKGRMNYLCLRKLVYLLDHADLELRPSQQPLMASVLCWVTQTQTGDLSELAALESRLHGGFALRLASNADECAGRSCSHYKSCFLRRARTLSLNADIIIANHALVFAEMQEHGQAIPPHAHLVFDEAHNLEDAATRYFSIEISKPRFWFLLRRLGRLYDRKGHGLVAVFLKQLRGGSITGDEKILVAMESTCQKIDRAAQVVDEGIKPFFEACAKLLENGVPLVRITEVFKQLPAWANVLAIEQELRQSIAHLVVSLEQLLTLLNDLETDTLGFQTPFIQDFGALRASFIALREDLGFVLALDNPETVYWCERDFSSSDSIRLMAAPIDIGEALHDHLYTQKDTIIFTSATLTVRGHYAFVRGRLGLDLLDESRLHTLNVGTPFDIARQVSLLVPMFLPEPTASDQAYERELSAFLGHVFTCTQGRGMTLFTSYAMLQKTTADLRQHLEQETIAVLAQGEDTSREALTEQFRDDVGSILMGTHSFWEGVDVVGESLSCVVLARLPFAVFTDPIVAARCEALEAQGQSAFTGYLLPSAVIRFRQGFGRLIRHRQDRGVVIVADRRIMTKSYGHWFRASVDTLASKCFDEASMLETIGLFLNGVQEEDDGAHNSRPSTV